jgi:hypothetical protein
MLTKTLISKKLSKLIKIATGLPGMGGEGSKLPKPYKGWQFKYEKLDPFTPLEYGGLTGDLIMGGWSFSLPLSLYKTRLDDVQKQLRKTFDEIRGLNDEMLRVISSPEANRPAYIADIGWSYPHDFDSMAWNYLSRVDSAIGELIESSIKVLQPHLKQLNYITRYAPPDVSVFDVGNPQLDWRLYTLATLMRDDLVISTIFQGPLPEHIKYDLIERFSHARLPSLLVALPEIINLEKRILSEDLYDKAAKGGEILIVDPKGSEGIIDLYVARLKPVRRDGNTYMILQTRSPTHEEVADLAAEIYAKSVLAKRDISELKARDTTGELNRAFAEKGGSLDYFIDYLGRYEQLGSMAERLYSSQRMPEPVLDLAKSVTALAASDFEKIAHKFSSVLHKVYTETMISPEPGTERVLLPLFRLLRPGYLLDITEPNKGNLHVVVFIGSSPFVDLPAFQHLSRISLERYIEPVSLVRRTPLGKWWTSFRPRR